MDAQNVRFGVQTIVDLNEMITEGEMNLTMQSLTVQKVIKVVCTLIISLFIGLLMGIYFQWNVDVVLTPFAILGVGVIPTAIVMLIQKGRYVYQKNPSPLSDWLWLTLFTLNGILASVVLYFSIDVYSYAEIFAGALDQCACVGSNYEHVTRLNNPTDMQSIETFVEQYYGHQKTALDFSIWNLKSIQFFLWIVPFLAIPFLLPTRLKDSPLIRFIGHLSLFGWSSIFTLSLGGYLRVAELTGQLNTTYIPTIIIMLWIHYQWSSSGWRAVYALLPPLVGVWMGYHAIINMIVWEFDIVSKI